MSIVEVPAGEVEDLAGGFAAEVPAAGDDGELVLPDEVVAELAARLAERARSGGRWP